MKRIFAYFVAAFLTFAGQALAKGADEPNIVLIFVDVSEQDNIAAEHPEVVARLLSEMNAFRGGKPAPK